MIAGVDEGVNLETMVKSLYHITKQMDENTRTALLYCSQDNEEDRVMDYTRFSSLLLNIVAAGGLNFHDVANSMTLSFCKGDVTQAELMDIFTDDAHLHTLPDLVVQDPDATAEVATTLQNGRMNRLFNLWDTDHSGDLDFEEVVLGFSTCILTHRFLCMNYPWRCVN